jgi:hypothetical protein
MQSNHVPSYAKLVMITQTIIILFFSYWVFEQYTYDMYFQTYVNGLLANDGLLLVIIGSIMLFAMIGIGFYARLHSTRKRLDMALGIEKNEKSSSTGSNKSNESITILEPHVEQHLIEMIRKNSPADNLPTGNNNNASGNSTQVLKKENSSPGQTS